MNRLEKLSKLKRKKKLKLAVLLVFVLVCGMLLGSSLTIQFLWRGFSRRMDEPGRKPEMILNRISDKLDLSEEQEKKLEKIFAQHMENAHKLFDQIKPLLDNELESFRKEVDAILNKEQKEEWNQQFQKMQKMMNRHKPPGFPRGFGKGMKPPFGKPDHIKGWKGRPDLNGSAEIIDN